MPIDLGDSTKHTVTKSHVRGGFAILLPFEWFSTIVVAGILTL